jgi:hypothetical protein
MNTEPDFLVAAGYDKQVHYVRYTKGNVYDHMLAEIDAEVLRNIYKEWGADITVIVEEYNKAP